MEDMTTLDDLIIRPNGKGPFSGRQGTFFWPKTYKYASSDGLKLRSKKECDWHSLLSSEGMNHTYEPNISGTRYRPDFGIANNFLIEVCGMVDSPLHTADDSEKKDTYKSGMDEKRKEFISLGYNILEVYSKEIVLNGHTVKKVEAIPFILAVVKKYNPGCRCMPKQVSFRELGSRVSAPSF